MTEHNCQKQIRLEAIKANIKSELSDMTCRVLTAFIEYKSVEQAYSEVGKSVDSIMDIIGEWEDIKVDNDYDTREVQDYKEETGLLEEDRI